MTKKSLVNKSALACRICGWLFDAPAWGIDGNTPTYSICSCCGAETGVHDAFVKDALEYRKSWIDAGCKWFEPNLRPKDWSLQDYIDNVPCRFGRDVVLPPPVEKAKIGLLSFEMVEKKPTRVPARVFFTDQDGVTFENTVCCSKVNWGGRVGGVTFPEPKWLAPGEYRLAACKLECPDEVHNLLNFLIDAGRGTRTVIRIEWQGKGVSGEQVRFPRQEEFAAALSWVLQSLEVKKRISVMNDPSAYKQCWDILKPLIDSDCIRDIPIFREMTAELQFFADDTYPLKGLLSKGELYRDFTTTGSIDWIDYLIKDGNNRVAETVLNDRLSETCVSRGVVDRWRLRSLFLEQNRIKDAHSVNDRAIINTIIERGETAFEHVCFLEDELMFNIHRGKILRNPSDNRAKIDKLLNRRENLLLDSEVVHLISILGTIEYDSKMWEARYLDKILSCFEGLFDCKDCWHNEDETCIIGTYGLLQAMYGCEDKGEKHLREAIASPAIPVEYKRYLQHYLTRLLLRQKRFSDTKKELLPIILDNKNSLETKEEIGKKIDHLSDLFSSLIDYQFVIQPQSTKQS